MTCFIRGECEEASSSNGGRGLLSVAGSVNIEHRSLHCHIRKAEENLLKAAQKYLKVGEVGPKEYKRERK